MASAKVKYVYTQVNAAGYAEPEKVLCFICASRIANKADTGKETIALKTTDYEFEQCNNCGKYIEDEVVI